MSAESWGLVLPVKGAPITPFRAPFVALGESVASALDRINQASFPRYAKRSDLPTSGNLVRQHATVYADTTTGNNGDYYWNGTAWVQIGIFGTATGTVDYSGTIGVDSSVTVDINFPTGRFSKPPIVTATSTNSRCVVAVSAVTTQKATLAFGNRSLASTASPSAMWQAIQMTSAAAEG